MIKTFIARIDRLEKRYGRDKYATHYLVPADELKAVRDELKNGRQQTTETEISRLVRPGEEGPDKETTGARRSEKRPEMEQGISGE